VVEHDSGSGDEAEPEPESEPLNRFQNLTDEELIEATNDLIRRAEEVRVAARALPREDA
jgi:hypothetical protein